MALEVGGPWTRMVPFLLERFLPPGLMAGNRGLAAPVYLPKATQPWAGTQVCQLSIRGSLQGTAFRILKILGFSGPCGLEEECGAVLFSVYTCLV